jgi:hypothetical protein
VLNDGVGTIQRGGAVYIGIGFTVANSTRKKTCAVVDDWVYALSGTFAWFNEPARSFAAGVTTFSLATRPSVAKAAKVVVLAGAQSGAYGANIIDIRVNTTPTTGLFSTIGPTPDLQGRFDLPLNLSAPELSASVTGAGQTPTVNAVAYKMGVPRMTVGT